MVRHLYKIMEGVETAHFDSNICVNIIPPSLCRVVLLRCITWTFLIEYRIVMRNKSSE